MLKYCITIDRDYHIPIQKETDLSISYNIAMGISSVSANFSKLNQDVAF